MKIRINLAALTRMEYSKEVEVPDDITEGELEDMVSKAYVDTDETEYTEDNEYWEKGHCWWEKI